MGRRADGGKGREGKHLLTPTGHRRADFAFHPRPCSAYPSGRGAKLSISCNVHHPALAGNGQASTCLLGSPPPQPVLPEAQLCIPFPFYQELSRPGSSVSGLGVTS